MGFVRIDDYCVNVDNIQVIKKPYYVSQDMIAYGNAERNKWCLSIDFVKSERSRSFFVKTQEEATNVFEAITGYPIRKELQAEEQSITIKEI